jgi:hypothetical protein
VFCFMVTAITSVGRLSPEGAPAGMLQQCHQHNHPSRQSPV